MKSRRFILSAGILLVSCLLLLSSVAMAAKPKKPKGLIMPEGDNATLVTENGYSVITFPETLTPEEEELYNTDFVGYILKLNGKISSSGNEYNNYSIYYYLHDSREWLFKGKYENPSEMIVNKIKQIKISTSALYLRDFNKNMPLLDGSKEKKNDSGYQNDILFGSTRYIFIDILLRDQKDIL